ncbi:MAG TPA: DUF3810 domain-containing protein [Pedobacter sp.]|nr:DUF3810 domain-containing protein [Pedobacter sp.]
MNNNLRSALSKLVILAVASVVVYIIGYSDITVEVIYAEGTYKLSSVIQRFFTGLLPFAIGDFLYLLLVLYVIRSMVLFYRKMVRKTLEKTDRIRIPAQIINFILILYLLFKISWGLNYSRPTVSTQLGISNEKYTTPELVLLGKFYIQKLNRLSNVKRTRYNIDQLRLIAKAGYDKMEKKYPFFSYPCPSVKPVLNSYIITKIGIEGYYNPLSGEANVNMRLPATELPFVTCHEIAHQLGIGREDEANLIGYLVASNSPDQNFQYSAAYAMLKSILFEIRIKAPQDYELLYSSINERTIKDFEHDRDFWRKYNNQMFAYLDVAFDSFLKLNNQQRGTDSYQDIVLWLYNIHKKDL